MPASSTVKPQERSHGIGVVESQSGFCVGVELFVPHRAKSQIWVEDAVANWAEDFDTQWPGFRVLSLTCHSLPGNRVAVFVDVSGEDGLSRTEVARARMWWIGVPLFGDRSDTDIIIRRACYESRSQAQAVLLDGARDRGGRPSTM